METEDGYAFRYDARYLQKEKAEPVSLTLPLRERIYTSKTLFPFFDGLIPEGWMLELVHTSWKIDKKDRFGILLVACRDSIGRVGIRDECL